nr:FAD-dependent oxidoreductase [Enterococcus durans]
MKKIQSEIIVIGGGLAGICAAIAAAREGKQVVLIQNRGVLGGIPVVRSVSGYVAQQNTV